LELLFPAIKAGKLVTGGKVQTADIRIGPKPPTAVRLIKPHEEEGRDQDSYPNRRQHEENCVQPHAAA